MVAGPHRTQHKAIDNPAVEPLQDYSLDHLVIQVDLDAVPWLAALAEGAPGAGEQKSSDPYEFLSEFFGGVVFGLVLGPAYEMSLIFTPQQGKYQAFACHVDTPPDDMNLTRAALRIEDLRPVELTHTEWLPLPKIESPDGK